MAKYTKPEIEQIVRRLCHDWLADDDAQAVREAFRGLLDRVVFHPLPERGAFELELHGCLGALSIHPARTAATDGQVLGEVTRLYSSRMSLTSSTPSSVKAMVPSSSSTP